jgi:hypothetical protein
MHLQYGRESGGYDGLIVNNENTWSCRGRHIRPLSSTLFMNGRSASQAEGPTWRFDFQRDNNIGVSKYSVLFAVIEYWSIQLRVGG